MTINILHLYYDLMNLYGESGNIKALIKSLEDQKIKINLDKLTIGDEIDFSKYDFIYIGSSTEENQLLALQDLLKYKANLKEYINNNKFILSTGNSIELFGKEILDKKSLNIFPYITKKSNTRLVGDLIIKSNLFKTKFLGFQNRDTYIENNANPMYEDENIGVNYKNFYGSYMIGPVLVRNPLFNKYLVTKLIKSKNKKFKFKKFVLELDKKAYDSYLKTYVNK